MSSIRRPAPGAAGSANDPKSMRAAVGSEELLGTEEEEEEVE